jgi:hypothetical protein
MQAACHRTSGDAVSAQRTADNRHRTAGVRKDFSNGAKARVHACRAPKTKLASVLLIRLCEQQSVRCSDEENETGHGR